MDYAEMCKHGSSAPKELLEKLPQNQGRTARHKCAVGAYKAGVEEGKRIAKKELSLFELKKSFHSASHSPAHVKASPKTHSFL